VEGLAAQRDAVWGSAALRRALRETLLTMPDDLRGRAVLAAGMAARFASVTDDDYDPIRRMAREADRVDL
jgi:ABC-type phosphate/phosphonate transport system substrate-binding protein